MRLLLRGHVTYVADHGGAVVDEEAAVPPRDGRGGGGGHRAHLTVQRYIIWVIIMIKTFINIITRLMFFPWMIS